MKTRSKRRNKRLNPLVIPAALFLLTFAFIILVDSRPSVPPMDDVYIHLVFGRSLLSSTPLSFNEGEISSGFTSPFWLLPSGLASLTGRISAPPVLMVLSLLAAGFTIFLAGPLAGLLMLMAGPFLFHASSGMETSLACFFIVVLWRSINEGTLIRYRGLLLAASFLCRPELLVLALPLIIVMKPVKPLKVLILLIPVILSGFMWGLWNFVSAGSLLPSTFHAKQSLSWAAAAAGGFPGLLKGLLLTSPLFLVAAAAGTAELMKNGAAGSRRKGIALGSFPVLLMTTAFVLQPNSFFQMRYYVPAICASVLACSHWLGTLRRRRLNTLLLAASMLPGLIVFGTRRAEATLDVGSIDVDPALFLREEADTGATVAAADIGAVKWITGMHVLDLDGLVTPQRLPGSDREGWPWIAGNADYLLAFPRQYSNLVSEAETSIEFIEGFRSDNNVICGEDSVTLWRIR